MPWQQLHPPVSLVKGERYAAQVRIPVGTPKQLQQPALIKLRLESAGFYGVTVDMTRGPRVEGVWGLETQAGITTLPAEIASVWRWKTEDHKR